MRKVFIFSLILLLTLPTVSAMKVYFYFKNSQNGATINGVTVTILETGATYTLNSGNYITLTTGNWHVKIKKSGYWTLVLPVDILDSSNYPSSSMPFYVWLTPTTAGAFYVYYHRIIPKPDEITLGDTIYIRLYVKPYSSIEEGTKNVKLILETDTKFQNNFEIKKVIVNNKEYSLSNTIPLGNQPNGFNLTIVISPEKAGKGKITVKTLSYNPTTQTTLISLELEANENPAPTVTPTTTTTTQNITYSSQEEEAKSTLSRVLIVIVMMFIVMNALYYALKRGGY